jgi:hypothetical protein
MSRLKRATNLSVCAILCGWIGTSLTPAQQPSTARQDIASAPSSTGSARASLHTSGGPGARTSGSASSNWIAGKGSFSSASSKNGSWIEGSTLSESQSIGTAAAASGAIAPAGTGAGSQFPHSGHTVSVVPASPFSLTRSGHGFMSSRPRSLSGRSTGLRPNGIGRPLPGRESKNFGGVNRGDSGTTKGSSRGSNKPSGLAAGRSSASHERLPKNTRSKSF